MDRTRYAPLAGRILLGAIFLLSAFGKIANWSGTEAFMASKGMPAVAFFLTMAILLELAGALTLFTGFGVRVGAVALFVFLVPATLIFHNFWAYGGAEQQNQMAHFLKNLAIMGGLIQVLAFGPGPVSLGAWRRVPSTLRAPVARG
jgi:putative oxidoreductase